MAAAAAGRGSTNAEAHDFHILYGLKLHSFYLKNDDDSASDYTLYMNKICSCESYRVFRLKNYKCKRL